MSDQRTPGVLSPRLNHRKARTMRSSPSFVEWSSPETRRASHLRHSSRRGTTFGRPTTGSHGVATPSNDVDTVRAVDRTPTPRHHKSPRLDGDPTESASVVVTPQSQIHNFLRVVEHQQSEKPSKSRAGPNPDGLHMVLNDGISVAATIRELQERSKSAFSDELNRKLSEAENLLVIQAEQERAMSAMASEVEVLKRALAEQTSSTEKQMRIAEKSETRIQELELQLHRVEQQTTVERETRERLLVEMNRRQTEWAAENESLTARALDAESDLGKSKYVIEELSNNLERESQTSKNIESQRSNDLATITRLRESATSDLARASSQQESIDTLEAKLTEVMQALETSERKYRSVNDLAVRSAQEFEESISRLKSDHQKTIDVMEESFQSQLSVYEKDRVDLEASVYATTNASTAPQNFEHVADNPFSQPDYDPYHGKDISALLEANNKIVELSESLALAEDQRARCVDESAALHNELHQQLATSKNQCSEWNSICLDLLDLFELNESGDFQSLSPDDVKMLIPKIQNNPTLSPGYSATECQSKDLEVSTAQKVITELEAARAARQASENTVARLQAEIAETAAIVEIQRVEQAELQTALDEISTLRIKLDEQKLQSDASMRELSIICKEVRDFGTSVGQLFGKHGQNQLSSTLQALFADNTNKESFDVTTIVQALSSMGKLMQSEIGYFSDLSQSHRINVSGNDIESEVAVEARAAYQTSKELFGMIDQLERANSEAASSSAQEVTALRIAVGDLFAAQKRLKVLLKKSTSDLLDAYAVIGNLKSELGNPSVLRPHSAPSTEPRMAVQVKVDNSTITQQLLDKRAISDPLDETSTQVQIWESLQDERRSRNVSCSSTNSQSNDLQRQKLRDLELTVQELQESNKASDDKCKQRIEYAQGLENEVDEFKAKISGYQEEANSMSNLIEKYVAKIQSLTDSIATAEQNFSIRLDEKSREQLIGQEKIEVLTNELEAAMVQIASLANELEEKGNENDLLNRQLGTMRDDAEHRHLAVESERSAMSSILDEFSAKLQAAEENMMEARTAKEQAQVEIATTNSSVLVLQAELHSSKLAFDHETSRVNTELQTVENKNHELKKENDRLKIILDKSHDYLEQSKSRIAYCVLNLIAAETTHRALRAGTLSVLSGSLSQSMEKVSTTEYCLIERELEMKNLRTQYNTSLEHHAHMEQELNRKHFDEINEYESKITLANQDVVELREQVKSLDASRHAVLGKLNSAQGTANSLTEELSKRVAQTEAVESELQNYQTNLTIVEREAEDMKAQFTRQKTENELLVRANKDLTLQVESKRTVSNQLTDANSQIKSLQVDLQTASNSVEHLKSQLNDTKLALKHRSADASTSRQLAEELETKLQTFTEASKAKCLEFESKLEEFSAKASRAEASNVLMKDEIASMVAKHEEQLEENKRLSAELSVVGKTLGAANLEIVQVQEVKMELSKDKAEIGEKCGVLAKKNQVLHEQNQSLTSDVSAVKRDVEELNVRLQELQDQNNVLDGQCSMLLQERDTALHEASKMSTVKQDLVELKVRLQELQDQNNVLDGQCSVLVQDRDTALLEVSVLQTKIGGLMSDNQKHQQRSEKAVSELDALRTKVMELHQLNSDLVLERDTTMEKLNQFSVHDQQEHLTMEAEVKMRSETNIPFKVYTTLPNANSDIKINTYEKEETQGRFMNDKEVAQTIGVPKDALGKASSIEIALRDEIKNLELHSAGLAKDLEERSQAYTDEVKSLRQQLLGHMDTILNLRESLRRAEAKVTENTQSNVELDALLSQRNADVHRLEQDVSNLLVERQDATSKLQSSKNALAELRAAIRLERKLEEKANRTETTKTAKNSTKFERHREVRAKKTVTVDTVKPSSDLKTEQASAYQPTVKNTIITQSVKSHASSRKSKSKQRREAFVNQMEEKDRETGVLLDSLHASLISARKMDTNSVLEASMMLDIAAENVGMNNNSLIPASTPVSRQLPSSGNNLPSRQFLDVTPIRNIPYPRGSIQKVNQKHVRK